MICKLCTHSQKSVTEGKRWCRKFKGQRLNDFNCPEGINKYDVKALSPPTEYTVNMVTGIIHYSRGFKTLCGYGLSNGEIPKPLTDEIVITCGNCLRHKYE